LGSVTPFQSSPGEPEDEDEPFDWLEPDSLGGMIVVPQCRCRCRLLFRRQAFSLLTHKDQRGPTP